MVIFSPYTPSIHDWSEYGEITPLPLFKTTIIIVIASSFFMPFHTKKGKK